MTVLFEPASAIAAGLCMTARIIAKGVTIRHPRACGWCDWPVDELGKLIAGFNEWAGYDERKGTYSRFDASVFQGLPPKEQERLIVEAQAFEAEPQRDAMQPTEAPGGDGREDGPSWLL